MDSADGKKIILPLRISRLGGAFAAGFGLTALAGWLADLPVLATLLWDKIPMAPSTALLFIFFGAALFSSANWWQNRSIRHLSRAAAFIATLLALLLLVLSSQGIHWSVEYLGMPISGTVAGAPIGHMSPLTAFSFVLTGMAFLLLPGSTGHRPRQTVPSFCFASLTLLISVVLAVAYLLGGPLFYDSGVIPPALTTTLAFLCLAIALLASLRPGGGLAERPANSNNVQAASAIILVFAITAAGIMGSGYVYFNKHRHHFRAEVEQGLAAIAKLKVEELTRWRQERLSDASTFLGNENFSEAAQHFLEHPEDDRWRKRLLGSLTKVHETGYYERISFLDSQGVELLAAPESAGLPSPPAPIDPGEVLRSGQVILLDFHEQVPGHPNLHLLVPVFDATGHNALGILVFAIDPDQYLYPMIKRWPSPGSTAETLLVRRDGQEVLFLNDLRFQENAALRLRFPLTKTDLPAAMAVLGREGIIEGNDYRGVPVLAAVLRVPDSPWCLVARLDKSEVFASLREHLWMVAGLVVALLVGSGAVIGLLWRNQMLRFYSDRYAAAEALRESEERYRTTLDHMMEGCQIIGHDWRYLYVNDTAAFHGQRARDSLLGQTVMECYPGFKETPAFAAMRRCMEERVPLRLENEFTYEDGTEACFELSIQPVPEGLFVLSLDITERKLAEKRIEHLNLVLRAIRSVNRLITREKKVDVLIRQACNLLVEHRSYPGVLIVLTDENNQATTFAEAGLGEPFRPLAERFKSGELPPCCNAAYQQQGVPLIKSSENLCADCPISEEPAGKNAMCISLSHGKELFGYLIVTLSPESEVDPGEQDLICELAADLALALHSSRTEEAMKEAEEAHKALETQLEQAQKMEAVGRLAGGVAHDFNNMLQVILGSADIALSETGSNQLVRECLEEIQKSGRRSADLTRQLLAFARKQTIDPRIIDLNETIAGMLKMLERLIGEDIDLLWEPAPDCPPVMMDPSQLDQILANLVVNARDAISGVGKITIETGTAEFDEAYCRTHAGFRPGHYALLAVSDNGAGMDRMTLAAIFEPFFTTKPQGQGTGLGLSTVYGIVKQNGGFINVYSEPGQGSTFKIYLAPHQTAEAAVAEVKFEPAELPPGIETVLLVEDEAALLRLSEKMVERLGYSVLTAGNPQEAIRLAEQYRGTIDLLLTDVIMPEMNGRDLFQLLKKQRPGLACLFMSGYTANVISHHGVLDKGVHFIPKPFSSAELAPKIREALIGT